MRYSVTDGNLALRILYCYSV